MKIMTTKWMGISYFPILDHRWIHFVWKLLFCKQGYHLFDEVMSVSHHYLYCDACGLEIEIKE